MSISNAVADAYLSGETVRHAFFVEFHFKSGGMRIWNGYRVIDLTVDGNPTTWYPVGAAGSIPEVEDPIADTQASLTMRLSGVQSELLSTALAETDEIRGRLAFIYDQFFIQSHADETDWQPVGDFETYCVVRMDTVKVMRREAAKGVWERVLEVPCENMLTNGVNPTNGRYSMADQRARFPNATDNYFQYMMVNQNKRVRWPPG